MKIPMLGKKLFVESGQSGLDDCDNGPNSIHDEANDGLQPHKMDNSEISEKSSLRWRFWKNFNMRPAEDDEPQDWWIASTAIPLVAATAGPLANVMSIVALVSPWRNTIDFDTIGPDEGYTQVGNPDPHWCLAINGTSLALGLAGNIFLMFNFTQRVRYIIALPLSIILWFIATGLLVGIVLAMHLHDAPDPPDHVYSQGYWSGVIAAILYFILSMILMINMYGYFRGHYPQHFALTDDQRTLILQTTMFMIWLLVGAAIFQRTNGDSFANALYFSDVTVLTIGFGDISATNNVSRGILLPYAIIGVVILGLVVTSISRFAKEVAVDNLVRTHLDRRRAETFERSFSHQDDPEKNMRQRRSSSISLPSGRRVPRTSSRRKPIRSMVTAMMSMQRTRTRVIREEKDRFDAMRAIQRETARYSSWLSLLSSIIAFCLVWLGGALIFSYIESLTYFQALYLGFCTLLTIGYGDVVPKTNLGKPTFVVWSIIAVPTMTILVAKMSDTVFKVFDDTTNWAASFTLLLESGKYERLARKHAWLYRFLRRRSEKRRIDAGFQVGLDGEGDDDRPGHNRQVPTIEDLANIPPPTPRQLARQLGVMIRHVAKDVRANRNKLYSYEEWFEFTRLIRFSDPNRMGIEILELDETEPGLIEWDWIGESSPMIAEQTEPEWVLTRLCESLNRYLTGHEYLDNLRDQNANGGKSDVTNEDDDDSEAVLKKQRDIGILEPDEDRPPSSPSVPGTGFDRNSILSVCSPSSAVSVPKITFSPLTYRPRDDRSTSSS